MRHGIAILGAGSAGASHAAAIAQQAGLELVAAARTSADQLERFITEFGGEGYTDYRRILDRPDVDCVCIALPHHLHAEAVSLAAQAGKHIMLEKPMATTL